MRDQQKTWEMIVRADEAACQNAFKAGFHRKSGSMMSRGHWAIGSDAGEDGPHLIAVLEGMAGLRGFYASFENTGTAAARAEAAKGAVVAFSTAPGPDGTTRCLMWLKSWKSDVTGTRGGGVIKNHMKAVAENLRQLDSSMRLQMG